MILSVSVFAVGCADPDGADVPSTGDDVTAWETTVDDAMASSTSAPESAANSAAAQGRSDACGALACGSGTVTWGVYKLPSVRMSVKDTKCDGRQVGIQLQVEGVGGEYWGGPTHWNPYDNACKKDYYLWSNLTFEARWKIRSVNVVVWVKNGSAGPITYLGNRADNPST
jgi:hypothetical protein